MAKQISNPQRVATLLDEVHQAKLDAQPFAQFNRRDELKAIGVPIGLIDRGDVKGLAQ